MLLTLCTFLCLLFVTLSTACPNGSVPYFDEKLQCIFLQATPTYWLQAEEICMNYGGHLASIHSIFQNMFLSQISGSDFWIGANDLANSGTWSWMDGTLLNFTDWEKGQPSNISGNDCGAVTIQGGRWITDDCYKAKAFVCLVQISGDTTLPPSTTLPPTTTASTSTFKPTTTKSSKTCESGWTFFNSTGFCYKVFENSNWGDAENFCKGKSAHLASIHKSEENWALERLATYPADNVCDYSLQGWIGLYRDDENSNWKWTDGTPFDYTNWVDGAPFWNSDQIQNCVFMDLAAVCDRPGAQIENGRCDAVLNKFICKKSTE